jgi:hypothetical protein
VSALAGAFGELDPGVITETLGALREAPGQFGDVLRRDALQRRHRVLVVVDQLEELFTLSDDYESRRTFLAALLAAADDPSSPVRIVLSMRADFLDRLAGHKQFLAELSRGLFFLSAPDVDNLRETLVRPVELAGYTFESADIVDDMVQTAASRGALPLAQFAATRLWEARDRTRRLLTVAAYNAMGGVGGAFARHADEIAQSVAPSRQPLLRALLSRLVTPEGTRAVVDRAELAGLAADPADVDQIVDQLARGRLILVRNDPAQGTTIEIVHDVLIDEWPTLRRWLEDGHALRGFLHEVRQATRQWSAHGRSADLIWRGVTAQRALATVDQHVLDVSANEREFLAAVRALAIRARRRRLVVASSILVALALVIGGSVIAVVRISAAERVAAQKAVDAAQEAERAREAEARVQAQLDEVKAANDRRTAAELVAQRKAADADQANAGLALSREQLQQKNRELEQAIAEATAAQTRAERAAKDQAAAATTALAATREAKAANSQLKTVVEAQRARVKQLEAEKRKIFSGGLQ